MYLYVKTPERCHTPKDMWEKIPLHPNFLKSIQQVNKYLEYWPFFLRKKIKHRMTKIRQYLIRMRRLRSKVQPELIAVDRRKEKVEAKREKKAHAAAQIQDSIRNELLERLRQGTYGELYDDIVNFNQQVYNDALDDIEEEEFDVESDVDEFVEAYSDEEEDDVEQEIEYEVERENRPKERAVVGGKRKALPVEEDDIEDSFDLEDFASDDHDDSEDEKPVAKPAAKKASFADRAKARGKKGKHVSVGFDEDSD